MRRKKARNMKNPPGIRMMNRIKGVIKYHIGAVAT